MSLFDGLFRRKVKLSDPSGWVFEGDTASGMVVNPSTAMNLSTAWSCVRLLSETIGTLPISVYRKTGPLTHVEAEDHPLYNLLHNSPNADMSAAEFIEADIAGLCLQGNAYAEKVYAGSGRIGALPFWRPDQVQVTRDLDTGARVYAYNDRGKTERLPEDKVFHLRGFGVGGMVGLSPISYARQTLGTALAAEETAGKLFANGMQQPLFIDSGQARLNKEQRKDINDLFEKFLGSRNAGKLMVLEAGMKPVSLAFNPDDAQLLETRSFHVEEICRWFRVPPFMIGHTDKVTTWGTGIEQLMLAFLTFSLRPYLTRFEQAAKKQLLSSADRAAGYYIEFNLDALLRADSAARSALYASLTQNGVITRNEARAKENLSPKPGGDTLTVQSALVPLDDLGKHSTGQGVANALTALVQDAVQRALEAAEVQRRADLTGSK